MPPTQRRTDRNDPPAPAGPTPAHRQAATRGREKPSGAGGAQRGVWRTVLHLAIIVGVVCLGYQFGRFWDRNASERSSVPAAPSSYSPPSPASQETSNQQHDQVEQLHNQAPAEEQTTPLTKMMRNRVIVVGAGLAGQSAAIVAAQSGAEVFLLDKESRLGGNSAKATSGINAWGTPAQATQHVNDCAKLFERDTFLSGKGGNSRPGLVRMLSMKSASAVNWLASFGIPLDVLSQLGGHSRKRTHRAPDKPDGTPLPIGYTTVSTLEKHIRANLSENIHIESDATMLRLLHDTVRAPNGDEVTRVTGVEYRKRFPLPKGSEGETEKSPETITLEADAVILATGGFSNDHTDTSLLTEHAPTLTGFPTTNGPWATGDGVKAAKVLGAELVDMDKVQLHPTGLLNPKDPQAKTVFLGPEALRGSGGILVNKRGERFINELELRSVVSRAIINEANEFPGSGGRKFAYCILNDPAADAFGRATLGFYGKKMNLFAEAEDVPALAKLIGCDEATLRQTLVDYEKVSTEQETCPKTGKSVFPCVLGPQGPFYVAYVTPSIHYTMGGCLISPSAEVQSTTKTLFGSRRRPILGLFGAGEVTGGVHGNNRLGGNSLLECVVFGRIAGERAALANKDLAETFPNGSPDTWVKSTVEEFLPEDGDEGDVVSRGGQLIFTLPSAYQTSGLGLGQALAIRGLRDGQTRTVYLQPSTTPGAIGSVGVYLPSAKSTFATPATAWLYDLQPGDTVELRAAPGAPGLSKRLQSGETDQLVIVADAPVGVAPVLQLLQAAREEPLRAKLSAVKLVYAAANASGLSYHNVIGACRDEPENEFLDCQFVLDEPPGKWTEGVGVIDPAMVHRILPPRDSPELARTTIVLAGSLTANRDIRTSLITAGFHENVNLFSLLS